MNQEKFGKVILGLAESMFLDKGNQIRLFSIPKESGTDIKKTLWNGIYIYINDYFDEIPIKTDGTPITSFNGLT